MAQHTVQDVVNHLNNFQVVHTSHLTETQKFELAMITDMARACVGGRVVAEHDFKYDWVNGDRDDYDQFYTDFIDGLVERYQSENAGEYVGQVIKWQVADGYAEYMVVAHDTGVQLAYIGTGDYYKVNDETIRGLTVATVQAMVERERALAELWATRS